MILGGNMRNNNYIEIARYYLTHLDMTQQQVADVFNCSQHKIASALEYYQQLVRYIPPPEPELVYAHDELTGVRNDAQRFERLLIYEPITIGVYMPYPVKPKFNF